MKREQTWDILKEALDSIEYKREPPPGRRFQLIRDDENNYAQLNIFTYNVNTYAPDEMRHTRHEFVVPVTTYNRNAWIRWVFDNILKIETHETTEFFFVKDESKCKIDCLCRECSCKNTKHDGRYSKCSGCGMLDHRFVCENGHYRRLYAPHHGNGWDPYTFWPGHDVSEKRKQPGDD